MEEKKVDGWVIHKRGTERTFLQLSAVGMGTVMPYFSTLEKLREYGDVLQSCGVDMSLYEADYAEGLEDNDNLWLNPDAGQFTSQIKAGRALSN